MPRGGRGILWHSESYDGPDQEYKIGVTETPTLTCYHCSRVVILNPQRTRAREWCWNCNSYICDECKKISAIIGCVDRERTLELILRYPGRGLSLSRGEGMMPLGDELALIESTKVYPGITLRKDE